MKKTIFVFMAGLLSFSWGNTVLAKIMAPPSVTEGDILYQSDRHSLEAIDSKNQKVLWKTEIPMEEYKGKYDPALEKDVQWNVITSLEISGDKIIVKNSKGEVFSLEKKSGQMISTNSSQAISDKIQQLKDPARSDSEKWDISRVIQGAGKAALPLLIGCVKDPTPIGKTPLTGGECINRPASLPIPPQCQNPMRTETLGERCELLLYNIITPAYTSPYMIPLTSKQAPPRPFVIPDWEKWWKKYERDSLEQIHQEARKKIDQFWLNNHQKSVVWE